MQVYTIVPSQINSVPLALPYILSVRTQITLGGSEMSRKPLNLEVWEHKGQV